jgi:hypothetical protein
MDRQSSFWSGGLSQIQWSTRGTPGSSKSKEDETEMDLARSEFRALLPGCGDYGVGSTGFANGPLVQFGQPPASLTLSIDTAPEAFEAAGILAARAKTPDGSPFLSRESTSSAFTDSKLGGLLGAPPPFASGSPGTAFAGAETITVTTDQADYTPGSTATFAVAGINPGGSVAFQIADLPGSPGANGIADVYAPFRVTDGGAGDLDGRANGAVVATWQVPADGRATGAELQLTATSSGQTANVTFSDAANKIVTENQKTGTPESTWAIHGSIANAGDSQIEGFTTQISTNAGQTVSFKINTAASGYTLDVYRLGYYGGDGATLVTSMHHTGADNQPNPLFNSSTNTVDAGNWSVTDSWAIPSTAVSGVYFAKLTTDSGNFQNIIPFVVRNDGTTSDILYQTSDETWEAYNPWGGYNLYQGPSGTNSDRANAVSYNRPIEMNVNTNDAQPTDFLFGEEFAAIYWLEQNGYSLNYISGIDAATNPSLLLNTKAYLDAGHDEYWTQAQFANVKAAADAGVGEAFLSGNQIYWDSALAPSLDPSQTANRTLVQYKDIWSGSQLDPNGTANGGAGLFRDPVYGPGTPENSLSGTIFTVDDSGTLSNIKIPASMSQLRFWKNTTIASGNGGTLTNLLGYEWDSDLDNGFRPAGLIDMSSTTMNVNTLLLDNGATTGPGTATHSLTLYRDPTSGALVFGAGTVMWSWGLDNQYVPFHGITAPISSAVQQSMVNLFADMGVTPQTLQASLVLAQASTDHTAPTSTITSPGAGQSFAQGQSVTITGTAVDSGGGIVAGVEVSTDGGKTWHPASGTTNWSYTFNISGAGTHVIEARATDDSVNLQTTPASVSINVTGSNPPSLFTTSNTPAQTSLNDGSPLEVGVKFTSSAAGQITALKFYRSPNDTGTDLLDLWTSTGTKLASATFTNTTASGWQTVNLATPVSISANTTYVVSYHTNGEYVATDNFFTNTFTNGTLTAPSSGSSGGNGVYSYGGTSSAGIFPVNSFSASNYFADVVFSSSTGETPPALVTQTPNQDAIVGSAFSLTLPAGTFNDPDGGALTYSATGPNGAALPSWLTFNASTRTFSGTPTSTDVGTDNIQVSATDPAGLSANETFNIAVAAETPPALVTQTPNQNTVAGAAFSLTLPAGTFNDPDGGALTYSATGLNGAALPTWLTFNASTRTFSGTPTFANVGAVGVQVSATDPAGLSANETFNIAVTDAPPVLATQTPDQNAVVGSAFSLALPAATFSDPDGGALAYSATGLNGAALPSWLTFNASTRTFSGTPTSADVGTDSIQVSATDPANLSASETFKIAVTTTPASVSLFTASNTPTQTSLNDGKALEVGMKFTSSTAGQITALKFYRSPSDTGSDLLDLWTSTGTKLASATFTNKTASGWQTVNLATPVSISANTTYIVSYHTTGEYVATDNFFTSALTSGPLTAPSSASSGGNGVYSYGGTNTAGVFPTHTFSSANYYADVVFRPQLAA